MSPAPPSEELLERISAAMGPAASGLPSEDLWLRVVRHLEGGQQLLRALQPLHGVAQTHGFAGSSPSELAMWASAALGRQAEGHALLSEACRRLAPESVGELRGGPMTPQQCLQRIEEARARLRAQATALEALGALLVDRDAAG